MPPPKRVHVLGVPVDCIDLGGALAVVDQMVRGNEPRTIFAVNPEKIIKAQTDSMLHCALDTAGLLIPDGIGVVFAVRLLWTEKIARVPGAELMPAICSQATAGGYKIFLFGSSREVNDQVVLILQERYPGISIVGHQDGYVDDSGMPVLIKAINDSGAQVLFVALGSPKQEIWIQSNLPELVNVRVCQGVGGTFDVIAGRVHRAPAAFRRANLEWLYRLITQPRRANRQIALPQFMYKVLRQKLRGNR